MLSSLLIEKSLEIWIELSIPGKTFTKAFAMKGLETGVKEFYICEKESILNYLNILSWRRKCIYH